MLLPPQRPAAHRQRERQRVVEAAAGREAVRLVDDHAADGKREPELDRPFGLARVQTNRVARALKREQARGEIRRRREIRDAVEREHRRELLARERMRGTDARLLDDQERERPRARGERARRARRSPAPTARSPPARACRRGNISLSSRRVSSASSRKPPSRSNAARSASATAATAITLFSDEHDVALSKAFERAIFAAASARSAVSSTIAATLPAPTPIAGVPLEYAARTLVCEPVATTRSRGAHQREGRLARHRHRQHLHEVARRADAVELGVDELEQARERRGSLGRRREDDRVAPLERVQDVVGGRRRRIGRRGDRGDDADRPRDLDRAPAGDPRRSRRPTSRRGGRAAGRASCAGSSRSCRRRCRCPCRARRARRARGCATGSTIAQPAATTASSTRSCGHVSYARWAARARATSAATSAFADRAADALHGQRTLIPA